MNNWLRISGIAICSAAVLIACNKSKTTSTFDENSEEAQTIDEIEAQDNLNKSKTIIYTLPAPVEVASIIKESGAKYDEDLLNTIDKAKTYTTNLKMALNLGIYSTDMSFANIFNQSQKTVDYITSLKQLTERLGIVQLVDEDKMNKFDSQGTTKDEMLNIVSEVYMNANRYLTENNRKNIAVAVMVGGWTEGLYIALNTIRNSGEKGNRQLTERIIAQKMALTTVLNILDSSNPNQRDEDLTYLTGKMNEIKAIYDEVRAEQQGSVVAITDADAKLTRIRANIQSEIAPDILTMLTDKVNQVRNEFTE